MIAPVCRAPDDDKYLATGDAADAAFLVSADRDLLDLGGYEAVRMVDASTFLLELGRADQEYLDPSQRVDGGFEAGAEDETTIEGEFREFGSGRHNCLDLADKGGGEPPPPSSFPRDWVATARRRAH